MESKLLTNLKDTAISEELFSRIKRKAEDAYKKTTSVTCPYFKKEVKFNSKGLDHIKFKEWGKSRSRKDQYTRLKFLPLVPRILEKTTTLQGFSVSQNPMKVRKKNFGKWAEILNTVYLCS